MTSPTRTIVIEISGDSSGDYTVREGDHYCPSLCWDEMLGTIAELTHPRIGQARYRMWTAEEESAHQEWLAGRRATQHTPPLALPAPPLSGVKP